MNMRYVFILINIIIPVKIRGGWINLMYLVLLNLLIVVLMLKRDDKSIYTDDQVLNFVLAT